MAVALFPLLFLTQGKPPHLLRLPLLTGSTLSGCFSLLLLKLQRLLSLRTDSGSPQLLFNLPLHPLRILPLRFQRFRFHEGEARTTSRTVF